MVRSFFLLFIFLLGSPFVSYGQLDASEEEVKEVEEEKKELESKVVEGLEKNISRAAEKEEEEEVVAEKIGVVEEKEEDSIENLLKWIQKLDRKRADEYYEKKDYEKAKVFYELSLRWKDQEEDKKEDKKSQEARVLYRLGVMALLGKEDQKALSYFQSSLLFLVQDKLLEQSLLYHLGIVYRRLGEEELSIKEFKKVLDLNPKHWKAHLSLGDVLLQRKEYGKAIKVFTQFLESHTDKIEGWLKLGQIYEEQGLWKKAMEEYLNILKIDPNHSKALHRVGRVHLKNHDYEKAKPYLEKVYRLDPQDHAVVLDYAKVLLALDEYSKARLILEQTESETVEKLLLFANLLYRESEYNSALESLEKAIELGYRNPALHEKLGDILFHLDRYDEAILYYRLALRSKENRKENLQVLLREKLALSYFKQQYFQLSAKEYLWLVQKKSDRPLYFQRLGESYLGYHSYDRSKKVFEHLLLRFPDYEEKERILRYQKEMEKLEEVLVKSSEQISDN